MLTGPAEAWIATPFLFMRITGEVIRSFPRFAAILVGVFFGVDPQKRWFGAGRCRPSHPLVSSPCHFRLKKGDLGHIVGYLLCVSHHLQPSCSLGRRRHCQLTRSVIIHLPCSPGLRLLWPWWLVPVMAGASLLILVSLGPATSPLHVQSRGDRLPFTCQSEHIL
jgi:hypothetical protein